jgi:hypothetical protein
VSGKDRLSSSSPSIETLTLATSPPLLGSPFLPKERELKDSSSDVGGGNVSGIVIIVPRAGFGASRFNGSFYRDVQSRIHDG